MIHSTPARIVSLLKHDVRCLTSFHLHRLLV
jgi:hypothetical protein